MPVPDYTAYPSQAAVEALVTGAGLTLPTDTTYAPAYIQAAIDEWESVTVGGRNFLAAASASFRYDPPGPNWIGENRGGGRRLLLDRPFTTISAVAVGVSDADLVGQVQTSDLDYRPWPYNASADHQPITCVEFTYAVWGAPKSVMVTGTPGYTAVLKAEVWNAIRMLAASNYVLALREGAMGAPVEQREADVMERKDEDLIALWGMAWSKQARDVMRRYVRL